MYRTAPLPEKDRHLLIMLGIRCTMLVVTSGLLGIVGAAVYHDVQPKPADAPGFCADHTVSADGAECRYVGQKMIAAPNNSGRLMCVCLETPDANERAFEYDSPAHDGGP